jgi:uncharacterized protein Yka (UPF0111/DUF47 family)
VVVASKTAIVASLGERKLALPRMVNEALAANDRIKYLFTLLQAARHQADDPQASPPKLRNERLQAGIEDESLDGVPGEARRVDEHTYHVPALPRILAAIRRELGVMLQACTAGEDELTAEERASFERRAAQVLPETDSAQGELIRRTTIDQLTRAQRDRGDSAHLLVMDMHKALNRLQHAVAGETLDGAAVYGLAPQDRLVVQAFMQGLHRTAPLKFDHPGLGTTATRSGSRLVIQNDIGTTDAHVLVVHVEGLACTLTYTDVHLQRLLFLQGLFARYAVQWEDTRSVRDRTMEDGLYHLALGRYAARDDRDLLDYVAFLGSRIVFLIDWNRARKGLRSLVRKGTALRLLRWAADEEVGHMAFLRLGGDRVVFEALDFAARGELHLGQSIESLFGAQRATEFLRFVLRTASEAARSGRPDSLVVDEIRAELLRHVRSSGLGLLDLVAEHAAIVVEIASAVRDALQGLRDSGGPAQAGQLAARAKVWESDADRLLNQVRGAGAASEDARFLKGFIEQADDVADDLEDAAFFVTLLDPAPALAPVLGALIDLGNLLTAGSQELVKALSTMRAGTPGAAREDTVDFLEAIHRIAGIEHEADTARRQVAGMLARSTVDARQIFVASECAARLERASDALLRVAFGLRDHVLREAPARAG